MSEPLIVAKVGGSLYDLPDLGARLKLWLGPLPRVLLVPGGGAMADAVRRLDNVHGLGEEASHWLALRALELNAQFLSHLLGAPLVTVVPREGAGWHILKPYAFF